MDTTYAPGMSPEPWPLNELASLWQGLSAGAATFVALAMLAVAAWLASRALPLYRAMRALRTAPLVKIAAGDEGLVKVAGQAYPGQSPPPGMTLSDDVWHRRFRMSATSSGRGTSTYSVGVMLLRDDSGECLVDPRQARVFASQVEAESSHFLGSYERRSDHRIKSGDPVFAIGVLGKAKVRPGQGDQPRCTLRPSPSGVLIFSGRSEARTLLRLQARYWPVAGAAFLTALLAIWGLRSHALTYESGTDFFRALISHPWATLQERMPLTGQGVDPPPAADTSR